MAQLIIQTAACVTHLNNTFFSFPRDTKFPSPTDLASFPAAGISPGSLAKQWRTITQGKKPCGTDKCSFYWAGGIMLSHQSLNTSYLSQPRRGKREKGKGRLQKRSQSDQDRQRREEVSWRLWRHWDNPWQPSGGILNNLALYSFGEYHMSDRERHSEMVWLRNDREFITHAEMGPLLTDQLEFGFQKNEKHWKLTSFLY